MQAEEYVSEAPSEELENYTLSPSSMIRSANYKEVLLPDTVRIGVIVVLALLLALAIRKVTRSNNKYAGLLLLAFILALAGIAVSFAIITGLL